MDPATSDCHDDRPTTPSYTIASYPPDIERPARRSWWSDVFAEARSHPGEWRRLHMAFAESTARQAASDIRNAYRRDPSKMRFRGIAAAECWDARCAPAQQVRGDDATEKPQYWLWLVYQGPLPG